MIRLVPPSQLTEESYIDRTTAEAYFLVRILYSMFPHAYQIPRLHSFLAQAPRSIILLLSLSSINTRLNRLFLEAQFFYRYL